MPALLAAYLFLCGVNDLQVGILSVVAIAVTLAGLDLIKARLFSFFTIYAGMCMIAYPIAAFMNIIKEVPAVRDDLWPETPEAMIGYIVSIIFLLVGAKISNNDSETSTANDNARFTRIKPGPLLFLYSFLLLVAFVMYKTGMYYHSSIDEYNFELKGYLNLLTHVTWISYVAVFIQLRNYLLGRRRTDLLLLLGMSITAIAIYLPSGSREMALGFMPLLLVCYYEWEKDGFRKVVVSITCVIAIMMMLIIVDAYRGLQSLADVGLIDKYSMLTSAAKGEISSELSPYDVLAGRLADYVAAGRIIATTPEQYNFRGFEGVSDWWQIGLPAFLRPQGNQLNFSDGAEIASNYGVSQWESSSSPVMTIGDLFSRFGWTGIVIGSIVIGYLLSMLDRYLYRRNELFKIIFFVLFARIVWRLYTTSLLINVVSFTRDLFLVLVISTLIFKWLSDKENLVLDGDCLSLSHARQK